jgi:hypothetical protein
VQCLLGFANFYRIFIKDYSKIPVPLTRLIRKDKFVWDEKAKEAFETFKKAFISTPILIHADSSKPFFLQMHQTLHWVPYSLNMAKMDDSILLHIVLANSLL